VVVDVVGGWARLLVEALVVLPTVVASRRHIFFERRNALWVKSKLHLQAKTVAPLVRLVLLLALDPANLPWSRLENRGFLTIVS
jgi:hypothetical protein